MATTLQLRLDQNQELRVRRQIDTLDGTWSVVAEIEFSDADAEAIMSDGDKRLAITEVFAMASSKDGLPDDYRTGHEAVDRYIPQIVAAAEQYAVQPRLRLLAGDDDETGRGGQTEIS